MGAVSGLRVLLVAAVVAVGLSGCATASGDAAELEQARSAGSVPAASGASAAASSAPVARTREDARFEREMRASGWNRDGSGVYVRIASGGVCSGACVVEVLDPVDCPAGIRVAGVRDIGGVASPLSALTPPASGGRVVTVTLPPPSAGTRITSAVCAS